MPKSLNRFGLKLTRPMRLSHTWIQPRYLWVGTIIRSVCFSFEIFIGVIRCPCPCRESRKNLYVVPIGEFSLSRRMCASNFAHRSSEVSMSPNLGGTCNNNICYNLVFLHF